MDNANRDLRLKRRQEADDFRRIFQPISMLFGFIGVLLLLWVGLTVAEGRPFRRELVGAGVTLIGFPVLVYLFRLVRGHFRKDLRH